MKKKYLLIILAALLVVGSLFGVLASNMLFDDLFNKAVSFGSTTLIASLPAVSIAVLFILGVLYVIRTYRHPDCKKRIARCYLIIAAVFSLVGVITSILSGVTIYHTFVGTHPFAGYLIIFLILNVCALGCSCYLFLRVNKWPEDKERVHINFLYVLKTIGWVLFIGMVFNKFGLFLGSPIYIYWRSFYQTFPAYLHLLVPVALGVVLVLYNFEVLKKKQVRLASYILLGVNAVLFAYTVIMGLNDTAFVSNISQLMPISRMAALPIEIIIHFLAYTGVGIALLVIAREKKEKAE